MILFTPHPSLNNYVRHFSFHSIFSALGASLALMHYINSRSAYLLTTCTEKNKQKSWTLWWDRLSSMVRMK